MISRMVEKYYCDTCIWRDFYENRTGLKGKPLGKYASDLFIRIIKKKEILLYSDLIIKELTIDYGEKEITDMFNFLFLANILKRVEINKEDYFEAKKLAEEKEIPIADVLHAILSRNNKAIFVSQDQHAQELKELVKVKKPEEIN